MDLEEALKRATELIKAKEDKKLKQSLDIEDKPKQKRNIREDKKEKIRETLREAREKSLLVRQAKKQILEGMKEPEKGLERHRTERKTTPPSEEIKPIMKESPPQTSQPVQPAVPVVQVAPAQPAQLAQPPAPQLPTMPRYYMPTMKNIKKLQSTMYAPF
ncbi:hypothetical protein [Flavobacterium sp.]|jgi:hypothetical protein|uniref:hypothetical protein n=1 Tax=Flavobacterium sp. TaxID=239 RepID=UPI0037BF4F7A